MEFARSIATTNAAESKLLAKVIRSRVFSLIVDWRKPGSFQSCKAWYSHEYSSATWATYNFEPGLNVLKTFRIHREGVVHIDHFERILDAPEAANVLNQQRDALTAFPITLILSVYGDNSILRQLQKLMPDLWSILKLTLEFSPDMISGPPLPDYEFEIDTFNPDKVYEGLSPTDIRSKLHRRIRRYNTLGNSSTNLSYQAQIAKDIAGMYVVLGNPNAAIRWTEKARQLFFGLKQMDELLWASYYIVRILLTFHKTKAGGQKLAFEHLTHILSLSRQIYGDSPQGESFKHYVQEQIQTLDASAFQAYLQQNNLPTP